MPNTYYHNPRCSKSRAGLELLNEKKVSFTIKEYLKEELSFDEIETLCQNLRLNPYEVVRKKEEPFKRLSLENEIDNHKRIIEAIIAEPILLERPIFSTNKGAVMGRPTEKLEEFLCQN